MLLKIKLAIYAALIASVCAVFWYQSYQIDKLQANLVVLSGNNAKLKVSVNLQKETMVALETGLSSTIKLSNDLSKNLAKANEERQIITQELNSYRGRLSNAALKKPALIERRTTAATNNILRKFAEATGSKNSSGKNRAPDTQ